jgi:hypothetical protein
VFETGTLQPFSPLMPSLAVTWGLATLPKPPRERDLGSLIAPSTGAARQPPTASIRRALFNAATACLPELYCLDQLSAASRRSLRTRNTGADLSRASLRSPQASPPDAAGVSPRQPPCAAPWAPVPCTSLLPRPGEYGPCAMLLIWQACQMPAIN